LPGCKYKRIGLNRPNPVKYFFRLFAATLFGEQKVPEDFPDFIQYDHNYFLKLIATCKIND